MSAGVIAASYIDAFAGAPTRVGETSGGSDTTVTNPTAPLPSGLLVDDLLFFAFYRNKGGVYTPPTDWSEAANVPTGPAAGGLRLMVYTKRATGSDVDPVAAVTTASQYGATCVAYRGVTSIEDVDTASMGETDAPLLNAPLVDTSGADKVVYFGGGYRQTTGIGSIVFSAPVTTYFTSSPSIFYKCRSGDYEDVTPGPSEATYLAGTGGDGFFAIAAFALKA
jgi:hypothetical protein